MQYRNLGQSDLRVSSIGLGCVTFGREIDAEASFRVLDHALVSGINLLDTAEAYASGGSEEVIGQWLAARGTRGQVVLATKVRPPLTREHILESAEASLRRLRTTTIDLFLPHNPDPDTPLEETIEALDLLVKQGKARYVGYSNFSASQVAQALRIAEESGPACPVSVQVNYNLVVRDIEAELLPLCADRQLGVLAYSPLGGGFLTGKYARGGDAPPGSRFAVVPGMQPIYWHDTGYRVLDGLRVKAQALGVALPVLALAWPMAEPRITTVLVGARTLGHVDQALAAAALGMSADLRRELSTL